MIKINLKEILSPISSKVASLLESMGMKEDGTEVTSSYPRLWKYSGQSSRPFMDAYQWLRVKRRDDNIGNLWRVHDKLYNLERFIDKHPGGPDWIALTQGTDITESFETSHVVNVQNVEKILEKYYVKDAQTKRNSPYTFKNDGFYRILKQRVEPVFKRVGTGPTLQAKLFQDTLALLFLTTSTLGAYFESKSLLVLSGAILCFCCMSAHNFFHLRDTWRRFYFDFGLLSSHNWRISHALSHHMYPNTLLDLEINMWEPLVLFLPTKTKNLLQRYVIFFYQHVLFFTAFYIDSFRRLVMTFLGRCPLRPEMFLSAAHMLVMIYIAPSVFSGIKTWLLMQACCSYLFVFIGLTAGHHHPVCYHDGDGTRPDPDFGLCQLDATKDRAEDIFKNTFVVLATFGNHPTHHLFPTVCHSKLKHVKPIVEATLKEFEEDFQRISQWQLVVGLQKQYARNKPNAFKGSRNY